VSDTVLRFGQTACDTFSDAPPQIPAAPADR
jgi:hypothetical protein